MCGAVNELVAPRGPLFEVVGIRLTKDDTTKLIHTCEALVRYLDLQTEAIRSLPNLCDEQASPVIRAIQNRQLHINTQVAAIISRTSLSARPWIQEFADARTALGGKVRTINKSYKAYGWVPAARRYWPCMLDTYEWLSPLTLELREEAEEALQEQQEQQWIARLA